MKAVLPFVLIGGLAASPAFAAGEQAEAMAPAQAQISQGQQQVLGEQQVGVELVYDVQAQLRRQGYPVGPVDGLFGPNTRTALTQFQRDVGLDAHGRIDRETLAALGVPLQTAVIERDGMAQEGVIQEGFLAEEQQAIPEESLEAPGVPMRDEPGLESSPLKREADEPIFGEGPTGEESPMELR